jgi:hypothetical protein
MQQPLVLLRFGLAGWLSSSIEQLLLLLLLLLLLI